MATITYNEIFKITVKRDGVAFGSIRKNAAGYFFKPHKSEMALSSVSYASVDLCKNYIEETYSNAKD